MIKFTRSSLVVDSSGLLSGTGSSAFDAIANVGALVLTGSAWVTPGCSFDSEGSVIFSRFCRIGNMYYIYIYNLNYIWEQTMGLFICEKPCR